MRFFLTRPTPRFLQRVLLSRSAIRGNQGDILAISREDQSSWEKRAPLAPQHVKQLVQNGVKVIVQPSICRAYNQDEYQKAGAVIQEDMSEASAIIGIRGPQVKELLPQKTYLFYSHTVKAQPHNMPLLDAILQKKIRLIDYEQIVDAKNVRHIAFGQFAGISGMVNILHGLGLRLMSLGHRTPFLELSMVHKYPNLNAAFDAVRAVGQKIEKDWIGSPGPLVFAFIGAGHVSRGALEVFRELPHEFVTLADLPEVAETGARDKIYGCVATRRDCNIRKNAQHGAAAFDDAEFILNPERYESTFAKNVVPFANVIVNGAHWWYPMPRLLTVQDAKRPHRLVAIADISGELGGSIEFTHRRTTIDMPFLMYDAAKNAVSDDLSGPGVLLHSVDNLPFQLPRESTDFFGSKLMPFIGDILKSDATTQLEDFDAPSAIQKAVIASNGELAHGYRYIADLRAREKTEMLFELSLLEWAENTF